MNPIKTGRGFRYADIYHGIWTVPGCWFIRYTDRATGDIHEEQFAKEHLMHERIGALLMIDLPK